MKINKVRYLTFFKVSSKSYLFRPFKAEQWYFPEKDFGIKGKSEYKNFKVSLTERELSLTPELPKKSLVWLHGGERLDMAVHYLTEFNDFPPEVFE